MTIQEKAREFALKILEDQISAVEKAYLEGYEEGKSSVVIPQVQSVILEEDIEWHDFGLPSGKIWGFCQKKVTQSQANNYNLPSFDDVLEILKKCRITKDTVFDGMKAKSILLIEDLNGIEHTLDMYTTFFWVKEWYSPSPYRRKVNTARLREQCSNLDNIQGFLWDFCVDFSIASDKLRLVIIKSKK